MAAQYQKLTDKHINVHIYIFFPFPFLWQKGILNFPHNLFVPHFDSQAFDDASARFDLELREQRKVANVQRFLQWDRKAAVLYMNLLHSALLRGHPVMLVLKLLLMDPSGLFSSSSFDRRLFPPRNVLTCNLHLKHSLYIFQAFYLTCFFLWICSFSVQFKTK